MGISNRLLDRELAGGRYSLAVKAIKEQYGHTVELRKPGLSKFGRNQSLSSGDGLIQVSNLGAPEVFLTDNLINRISSANAADTQSMFIRGHTIDPTNGELTLVEQTITLNGQTPVALNTPLARAERVRNNNATATAGDVYVYESTATVTGGVPQETALTHAVFDQVRQASLKAAASVCKDSYFIMTSVYAGVGRRRTAIADIEVELQNQGTSFFYDIHSSSITNTVGAYKKDFEPFHLVKPNTDMQIRMGVDVNNVIVYAGFDGVFADIIPDDEIAFYGG